MEPKTSHPAAAAGHAAHCCGGHDHAPAAPALAPAAPADLGADPGASRFRIATMDCAAEESEIRRALDPIAGLRSLRFDLGQRTLAVAGTAQAVRAAVVAMRHVGFDPQPVAPKVEASHDDHGHGAGLWRLGAAIVLALGAEAVAWFAPGTTVFQLATLALAVAAIALAGLDTYKKGLRAVWAGRLNINALMTVAVTGAVLIGQWPEAAMVMALYALAEWIEARAVDRARNAITGLLALAPDEAEVQQPDGTWVRQPRRRCRSARSPASAPVNGCRWTAP